MSSVQELLAVRDVQAHFFEHEVAGGDEPAMFEGSKNSSGPCMRLTWVAGPKVEDLSREGREWGACLQKL